MYTSSIFGKGCSATSENSSQPNRSSGANTSSNRFGVGFQPLGDDNQTVRIQLAVHKYNNTPGNASASVKRSLISPVRHSFYKNSHKSRGYDGDVDLAQGSSKSEKRSENLYEGVGNFPTVHLKKSSVLYRPIRRLKEAKVPYPELPFNRLTNYLPEYCSEPKNNPQSVLDVLQDMSRKKIKSKCESNYPKYGCRGLGGGLPANEETIWRPLFVQKPKANSVSTRDNTTQTFSSQHSDASSVSSSLSGTNLGTPDPRAELRRKLAKQNNEIFASLSSSLTSNFAMKRKIDKISESREDQTRRDSSSAIKKAKIQDGFSMNSSEKMTNKTVNGKKGNSLNSSRIEYHSSVAMNKGTRNGKLNDLSAISPNKDRLTTIYLDIKESKSPKSRMFEGSASPDSGKLSLVVNGSAESPAGSVNGDKFIANAESPAEKGSTKIDTFGSIPSFNNHLQTPNSSAANSSEQFKLNASNVSPQSLQTRSGSTVTTTTITTKATITLSDIKFPSGDAKKINPIPFEAPQTFSSSSSTDSGDISTKSTPNNFINSEGADSGKSQEVEISGSAPKMPVPATTASQFQFCFSANNSTSKSPSLNLNGSISQASSISNTTSSPPKTLVFSFGQTPPSTTASSQASSITTPAAKSETTKIESFSPINNGVSDSSVNSKNAQLPTSFVFGQKPTNAETDSKSQKSVFDAGQFKTPSPLLQSDKTKNDESLKSSFPAFGSSSLTDSSTKSNQFATQGGGFLNSAKIMTEADKSSALNVSKANEEAPKQSALTFTFGQQASSTTSNGEKPNSIAVPESSKLPKAFSFGQNPSTQFSFTTNFAASTTQTSSSGGGFAFGTASTSQFGAVSQNPATSDAQAPVLFGQNVSQSSATSPTNKISGFGQSASSSQTKVTSTFDKKPGTEIFGSSSSPSIFGQNVTPTLSAANTFSAPSQSPLTTFGSSSAQTVTPFGGTGFQTTAGFGAPATTQSTFSFGVPKTGSEPAAFGNSNTFQSSSSTAATTTTTSTFGTSIVSQPGSGFGLNLTSTSNSAFGQDKSLPTSLGISSSNIFGQSGSLTQNSTSSTSFTAPTNTNFTASNVSNIFAPKTSTSQEVLFGQGTSSALAFVPQNKFTFGSSSGGVNGFQAPSIKTTASGVFTFGANPSTSCSSPFSFGSASNTTNSSSSTTSNPFTFNNQTNTAFKFGSSTGKESSGFNTAATPSSSFTFGAQQNNNNSNSLDAKPPTSGTFNFGSGQTQSSGSAFIFGSTPSPSVFSFGTSSSSSNNSTFNFGTPQPGGPFGQSTPTPGFSAPGTFSIGSGSSSNQSRPRASSRLRRRP